MNLRIISLGRCREPVCRELEKAVSVAARCGVVSMVLMAFPGRGWWLLESGQDWQRVNAGCMDGEPSAEN